VDYRDVISAINLCEKSPLLVLSAIGEYAHAHLPPFEAQPVSQSNDPCDYQGQWRRGYPRGAKIHDQGAESSFPARGGAFI
jgi:hypothetical protein